MKTNCEKAIECIKKGLEIIPLNSKYKPCFKDIYNKHLYSTLNAVTQEWKDEWNVGICCNNLTAIDVDVKNGRNGHETILALELSGKMFPMTLTQRTKSGGTHLIYSIPADAREITKNTVNVLGRGIDTRGWHGYLVYYGFNDPDADIVEAPQWVFSRVAMPLPSTKTVESVVGGVAKLTENSFTTDEHRAKRYLEQDAPRAISGEGGNVTTYRVACRIKDMGVGPDMCVNLMEHFWYNGCGWTTQELETIVKNAFRYGQNEVGENSVTTLVKPSKVTTGVYYSDKDELLADMNKEFAIITLKNQVRVLQELPGGNYSLLTIDGFKTLTINRRFFDNHADPPRVHPASSIWLMDKARRDYPEGIDFCPQLGGNRHGSFNSWTGFKLKPKSTPTIKANEAADLYFEHIKDNICGGDERLYEYVVMWLAQIIKSPTEKLGVALVLMGEEGVGKSFIFDPLRRLLGRHCASVSVGSQFHGKFNSHLRELLLLVSEEAVWGGDKQSEGVLKDLITGDNLAYEGKGLDLTWNRNYTRVALISNEHWVVPAGLNARRFVVIDVKSHRRKDIKFFSRLDSLLKQGGDEEVMRRFINTPVSAVKLREGHTTTALIEQKRQTMDSLHQWWDYSLDVGCIECSMLMVNAWPNNIPISTLYASYQEFARENTGQKWLQKNVFGQRLMKLQPDITRERTTAANGERQYVYYLPNLEKCRKHWENKLNT